MKYRLGARSLRNLEGVHPNLQKIIKTAISDSPVDFTVVEGLRTTARQQALFAQGRTQPGPRVTNVDGIRRRSNHQAKPDGFGHAVDIYPYFLGQVQVNHKDTIKNLRLIAGHIKKVARSLNLEISWGGDWRSFYDPPHFELR
ncbi:hypothetical protein IQ37_18730 [Chryseobacterium piperi]|uniref:Peptidase M15C domain-containing protein n=1 Tax=Chryseobacterium piperi TaxID=558152 RepID=A0A086AF45_9FLAO|nr:M15 family metallopeptidase [Chryseobacterium piperi]ASW73938.1 hypothetical protein CJF12_06300 [Chryseobacterium piperi]KFF15309.1 hypothetical protein IQ37_18730 [Chryseobacterium piperi]